MKSLRVWLLLLLALLLPVRGALAVAMQCPAPGSPAQVQVQAKPLADHVHAGPHFDHAQHLEAAADQLSVQDHAHDGTHDHGGAADKCNLCAASCSATALVSASVTVAEPQPVSAVFPHLYAPPSSFISDGQERPPRSI